jgi:hypothetical protein
MKLNVHEHQTKQLTVLKCQFILEQFLYQNISSNATLKWNKEIYTHDTFVAMVYTWLCYKVYKDVDECNIVLSMPPPFYNVKSFWKIVVSPFL